LRPPKELEELIEDGLVDEVVNRLLSGKEADVYVVRCGDELRCAKVYKDLERRSFKQAAKYREGRKVRNTRGNRAMEKGTRFGRKQTEQSWHNAEVEALKKLAEAGVRVPTPYFCLDGVLLMELITNAEGEVAPRLCEVSLTNDQALQDHATMMQEIIRMLCVGLVHGDLSEFNVLQDAHGPVIIDLPQAVNAAANRNAQEMLERDVNNITRYYARFARELKGKLYAEEIWTLYKAGELQPDSKLTGLYEAPTEAADVDAVVEEIKAAFEAEQQRLARLADSRGGAN
jgi:RIO kinase 1